MNENLIQVTNDELFTTSRLIAEKFNKEHKNVIRLIQKLIGEIDRLNIESISSNENSDNVEEFIRDIVNNRRTGSMKYFCPQSYNDSYGRSQTEYLVNRDGFSLLVMGFNNTRDVLEWKLKYIEAFNAMEEQLHSHPQQLPDNRLEVAKIIAKTPVHNVSAIRDLYPEYFSSAPAVGSLEYRSELNTGYKKWLEDMNIMKAWITHFPTTDIFLNYANYCKDYHLPSMGKKTFFKTIEDDFGMTRSQRHDGYRYFN